MRFNHKICKNARKIYVYIYTYIPEKHIEFMNNIFNIDLLSVTLFNLILRVVSDFLINNLFMMKHSFITANYFCIVVTLSY